MTQKSSSQKQPPSPRPAHRAGPSSAQPGGERRQDAEEREWRDFQGLDPEQGGSHVRAPESARDRAPGSDLDASRDPDDSVGEDVIEDTAEGSFDRQDEAHAEPEENPRDRLRNPANFQVADDRNDAAYKNQDQTQSTSPDRRSTRERRRPAAGARSKPRA